MPYTSVTLSSVGNSGAIALDWMGGKPVLTQVITSSSVGTADFTVQYTLDDIMQTRSSLVYWSGLSSTPYLTPTTSGAVGFHYGSSNIWPDGITFPLLAAPAALRIASTAISSNTLTLKVIQGVGG